ncbi:maleylpyruvate isomerase family mycothiol-dependent enzyme [Dactylosporangium sucinum]|uniref:TIGR03084 family protein n=1 Tax=Dactylosporangium sucinum TaxID=1424081 RepID=A0A917X100_9ACTN|nr:maleylpyruvate isomerase family mycothiol-dependent enzyme [Dactylosporangium sucinum]GGM50348.1 TIGR03084 family protein [Dactylosporangium sucinum]
MTGPDVVDDLEAEQEALAAVLAGLSPSAWASPSAAAGWTVTDVVLHLAQTEEAVVASVAGGPPDWHRFGDTVDGAMAALVEAERAPSETVFARWQAARRAAVQALRQAAPGRPVRWVAGALKPRTLATTRVAEHWAHALDVTGPLRIAYPDTARLRHIAWLGHSTLPYAFRLAGLPPAEVYCELTAPDGTVWHFGNRSAASAIRGAAGAFCRVGAHRLAPADAGLHTEGPDAEAALRVLRNYAA